jgi:peptidoglycan lytic transglycosylase F
MTLSEHTVRKEDTEEGAGSVAGSPTVQKSDSVVSADEIALDSDAMRILRNYGSTIRRYSSDYGIDWRLVLAVMKQESRFVPHAESTKGARGLMQMMPRTSREVARVLSIGDMTHPRNNIRGGIYYLSRLYDLFRNVDESDRVKLTLAAYNAGVRRIYDAQDVAAYFDEDPTSWQSIKDALPLLSKRYYTLHRNIWEQEKPTAGWFGNASETLTYVDNIMTYYDEYRLVLN